MGAGSALFDVGRRGLVVLPSFFLRCLVASKACGRIHFLDDCLSYIDDRDSDGMLVLAEALKSGSTCMNGHSLENESLWGDDNYAVKASLLPRSRKS